MDKQDETIEFSDSYIVFGADLSLNRPGFCRIQLSKDNEKHSINSVTVMSVDNKSKVKDMQKDRGEKLTDIVKAFLEFIEKDLSEKRQIFFVREQSINNTGFNKRSGTAARTGISETVGVMDYILWTNGYRHNWYEYYPVTIKKQLTGNHRASKVDVANAVNKYVGDIEFANDDESDAVAVALAWLIKNNCIEQIQTKEVTE